MATIFCDEDVLDLLIAADAVRWMGAAVDAHHRGELWASRAGAVNADFYHLRWVTS